MKLLTVFILVSLMLPATGPAFADEPTELPPGWSADVLDQNIQKEVKARSEVKIPEPVEVELPKPPRPERPDLTILVKQIRLAFHESVPEITREEILASGDLKKLLDLYKGLRLNFKELTELVDKIEAKLRGRGYLAVVRIPPQEIQLGEVALEILVARMGELIVEGTRFYRERKIRSYWRIPKGDIIRFGQLEAGLFSMNENPDRRIKQYLKAGKELGVTDVILKVEDRFPVHPAYTFDNRGVKLTGKERHGFSLQHNNFLTLDDTFLIGTVFGNNYGALNMQHIFPVNTRGTSLVWAISHAQVNPQKEFKPFGIHGMSQTYDIALQQRLFKNSTSAAQMRLGITFNEKETRILSVTQTWDRLRILYLSPEISRRDKSGVWILAPSFRLGFSPHGNGHPLTSRDAEPKFFKFQFSLKRLQKLFWETEAMIHFQGQVSPDRLVPFEEFYLGGASTVRGYPESDYGADQGLLTTIEYYVPSFFIPRHWKLPRSSIPLYRQLQAVVFLDYGYGRVRRPSSHEHRSRNMLGMGGGFRFLLSRYISARLEWAAALGDSPLTESGESQFHFRLSSTV